MTAYRRVYDARHLQSDCQEPGSAPEPYAGQSSMGYLYLFYSGCVCLGKLLPLEGAWKKTLYAYTLVQAVSTLLCLSPVTRTRHRSTRVTHVEVSIA